MAEGGGLLNRYRVKSSIGGSNPPLSAILFIINNLHDANRLNPLNYPAIRLQRAQEQNRERRLERYETVVAQARKGASLKEIARNCCLGRQTVRRLTSVRSFPERRPSSHSSTLDQHYELLERRWQQGCHNAAQLWLVKATMYHRNIVQK